MDDRPASRHFRSQRLNLHYADWGGAGLPPLILLHGGNDHCRNWDRLAPFLSDSFRVIAPDLRGHGDSGWSDDGHYSVDAHVYDLLALYRALEIDRAPILAHSFGGWVALRFAGLYPAAVSRLILLESATHHEELETSRRVIPVEQRIVAYFEALRRADAARPRAYASLDEAAERMKVSNPKLSDDLTRHLAEHGSRIGEDGLRRWKFDPRVRARSPYDLSPDESRRLRWYVTAQVLLIDGAESYGAPDRTPLDIPNAKRIIIPDAGHWAHHDKPREVLAAARAFLS